MYECVYLVDLKFIWKTERIQCEPNNELNLTKLPLYSIYLYLYSNYFYLILFY